jgi:hypothetical protein
MWNEAIEARIEIGEEGSQGQLGKGTYEWVESGAPGGVGGGRPNKRLGWLGIGLLRGGLGTDLRVWLWRWSKGYLGWGRHEICREGRPRRSCGWLNRRGPVGGRGPSPRGRPGFEHPSPGF